LAYLTGQLSTSPPFNPVGTSTVLSKLLPLMTDATGSVRSQLLKLLRTLPAQEVRPDVEKIMRYIRGAMTHISQEIKDDGLNYMEWLLEAAGAQVVESPGCWVKPLKDFAAILGWATLIKPVTQAGAATTKGKGGWTSAPRTTFGAKKYGASFPRQMLVLAQFLEHGFRAPTPTSWAAGDWFANLAHLPAGTPDPYGYVGLFTGAAARGSAAGGGDEEDARSYRDRDDRQAVFGRRFADAFRRGVDEAKREGGMAGRAAAQLDKVLREGMEGYDQETRRCNENEGLWDGYIM
jgi:pre-rRNA-processing protein IPI1